MARNYIQPGDVIEGTAPSGGITAGTGLLVGARLFGVALETKGEAEKVLLKMSGVFEIAKTSALAINAGDVLYWDANNKCVNKTAADQVAVGVAVAGAANPSATVLMRLGVATEPGTSGGG